MRKKILITGGAGFIGSHLCDRLIAEGHHVRVLDNLDPQVHGEGRRRPDYLHPDVELIVGDVCVKGEVEEALKGIDRVYHLAAKVGVGQSMYEISSYTQVNNEGTAVLLESLIRQPVEKLVVASSMSIYGEGLYRGPDGQIYQGQERALSALKKGVWELHDPSGRLLEPVPTTETKSPSLSSVYALSKYDQERLCLITGRAYGFPVTALRFFNVFGTRQALSNPYTGVLAIFASRYLNGKPPLIFEDGQQKRDFVHVKDVAEACALAGIPGNGDGDVLNIGSGQSCTISEIARKLAQVMGKSEVKPSVTGKYRAGDIRHCFADIGKAREMIGYRPQVNMEAGLSELAAWLQGQIAVDQVEKARTELEKRGLTV